MAVMAKPTYMSRPRYENRIEVSDVPMLSGILDTVMDSMIVDAGWVGWAEGGVRAACHPDRTVARLHTLSRELAHLNKKVACVAPPHVQCVQDMHRRKYVLVMRCSFNWHDP